MALVIFIANFQRVEPCVMNSPWTNSSGQLSSFHLKKKKATPVLFNGIYIQLVNKGRKTIRENTLKIIELSNLLQPDTSFPSGTLYTSQQTLDSFSLHNPF